MPDAINRERGGSGDGGRCTIAVAAGDARGPSADDRVGGDASGGDARDAEHEGDGGRRGPDAAGRPGDDIIEVEPDDGDGGGSVTLLTLVHTSARAFSPDVPQQLASNECSATRNASDGGTQRGGPKPGGADGVDVFVEAKQEPPPPPTVARVPASVAGPPTASGSVALAADNAVPVGRSEADASAAVPTSVKRVGGGGGESTLSPGGGLPRVGDTDMLDGIDSRAPGPSGTTGDGGVPLWLTDDCDNDGPRPRDDRWEAPTGTGKALTGLVANGPAADGDPSRPEQEEGPRLRPPEPPLSPPTAKLAAAGGDGGGNPPAAGDTVPNTGSVRAGRPADPPIAPGAPKKSGTVRLSPLPPPSTRPPPPPPPTNDIGGAVGAGAGAGASVGVSAPLAPCPPTAPSRRRANPKREHERGDVRGDGWMGGPIRPGGDVNPGLGSPPVAATRSAAGRREAPNRASDGVAEATAAGWRAATQPGPPGAATPLGRSASPVSRGCPRLRTLPAPPLMGGEPHSLEAGRVDAAAVGSGPKPGGAKPGGGGGWG